MKKRHILALSLPVLAVAILLVLAFIGIIAYVFLLPHGGANTAPPVVTNPYSPITCVGFGCREAASTQYGGIYCDGYSCQTGNVISCYQTVEEYCRGCKPTENSRACACTYNNVSARYCSLDSNCYTNQAAYDVGCTTNAVQGCAEMEGKIANAGPLDEGCGSAMRSVGVREEDCNKTWQEIYAAANDSFRADIRQYAGLYTGFEPPLPTVGKACRALCSSCNSTLCASGQICEQAD